MKSISKCLYAAIFSMAAVGTVSAADTPGTVTLTVQLANASGTYQPKHVVAVWVTDQTLGYIKCLWKDGGGWTGEGTTHLDRLKAARGSSTVLDGHSGATITTYNLFTVTWNCSNANNSALAPDGTYYFHVETTDKNSAGPYSGSLRMEKGPTAFTTNYPDQTYIKNMVLTYTPVVPPHNIAITRISPSIGFTNTTVNVTVTLTNKTTTPEANVSVTLSNLTTATLIGSQIAASLSANGSTNLVLPWNTAGLSVGAYSLKATADPVAGETSTTDNALTNTINLLSTVHDIAVTTLSCPNWVTTNTTNAVTVGITNKGNQTESIAVVLSDVSDAMNIGTNQVGNLATNASTNVVFQWRVPAIPYSNHVLMAVAGPVAGETELADNTNTISALVLPVMETNVLILKSNSWRYNDTGADLTFSPWKQADYPDGSWKVGRGSLGYGDPVTTTLSYGPDPLNKYPAYYFRCPFNIDLLPDFLILRLRRDDAAVVYHNGVEVFRANITNSPVYYTNFASASVDGTNRTTYFEASLPVTNAVIGSNTFAVELHRASGATNVAFDLELLGINPLTPRVHDVAVLQVQPQDNAAIGDLFKVAIAVTNQGNASETFTLYLRDTNSNQIVASTTVTNLAVGASATLWLNWRTLGATPGAHTLESCVVLGGQTNFAGMASVNTSLLDAGFGLNAVSAVGSAGGRCATLATLGNLFFVGAGATLEVWDRSNPYVPVKVGQVRLPGLIEGLAASGSFVYAACGSAGVQFVDVAVPSSPVHVNTYNTSGHAYAVAANASYLYIADGVAGVRIVNISAPASPTLAGAYYTEGPARAVALSGSTAYVLDQFKGLLLMNVANPASPSLLGAYTGFDAGQSVAVSGSYAYCVDANNHFFVVNIGTPSAPTLAGSLLLTNMVGQSVAVSGTTVYVAAGDSGLVTINAAVPTAPVRGSVIATPGAASAVSVAGPTLYLADGFAGFQVYSVSTPASPALQTDLPTAIRASDVAVNGDLAYVAAGENGLCIYSVTNLMSPVQLCRFTGVANARAIALSGTTAYVGDGQYGLKIVNVAAPAAPVLLGAYSFTNLNSIRNVSVSGSLVLVSDGLNVCLLDASDPAHPVLRDAYSAPAFAFSLCASGSNAFLACGNYGLAILTVTPSALSLAASYDTPGFATKVSVVGTNAYVADGPGGWLTLDVMDPASPSLIKSTTDQGSVVDLAVDGVLATVGNGANMATRLDVSVPLTPVAQTNFAGLTWALRLTASGPQTFVAEDEAGLAILSTASDVDGDGLPDAWEMQIVNLSRATNGPLRSVQDVRLGDDFDGDGMSNLAEFFAGTSPTDPVSRFMLIVDSNDPTTIRWTSELGKSYTVYKSTNLKAGFSVLADNITATPPVNSYPDPVPGHRAFYLIQLR